MGCGNAEEKWLCPGHAEWGEKLRLQVNPAPSHAAATRDDTGKGDSCCLSLPYDQQIAIYSSISLAPFTPAHSSGSARNLSTCSLLNTVTETNWSIHVLPVRRDFLKVSLATLAANVLHTRKENIWTNTYLGGKLLHTNPSLHASSCLLKKSYWKHRVQ